MTHARTSELAFVGLSALVFFASASATIVWCASMASMGDMPMPGGWTLSMVWMRMPGHTWLGAAATFVGMWVTMMAAMMLPSLMAALRRYREAVARGAVTRLGRLTALVGAGYFVVWAAIGVIVFLVGATLAAIAMRESVLSRAAPIAAGVVVLIAGVVQFTAWKARRLASCGQMLMRGRTLTGEGGAAWRYGLRLGLHCGRCCASLMAILLVFGVMDLRAMSVVTGAVTAERLAPFGARVARLTGAVAIGVGLFLIARAAGPG